MNSSSQPSNSSNIDAISEIKSRLDIVEVVSEHLVLKKSGRNHWGLCPFHKEKTPSFSVSQDKGIFKCFGCGEGGDSISFLMKVNNHSFFEVITELAQKFGIPLHSGGYSTEKQELKQQIYLLNESAVDFFHNNFYESKDAKNARDYLLKRGITEQIINEFELGFAPKQSDALTNYLIDNFQTNYDVLEKAGLSLKRTSGPGYTDRFKNRIIIPIRDEKGNYIAFGARLLGDNGPKYLNSPDTPVFNKSRNLFALYQAKDSIKESDSAIFMEGYFDVITAHASGLKNVVATLGTAMSESHLRLISKFTYSKKIFLAFDMDAAGINATDRGAEVIKSAFSGLGEVKQFDGSIADTFADNNKPVCEIRVVNIPTGKDPDEFIRTEGLDAYNNLINNAPLLIDYQINRIIDSKGEIKSPQQKSKMVKTLIPVLCEVKNTIVRNEYIKILSERLEVDEESFNIEVKKNLQRSQIKDRTPVQIGKSIKRHLLAQKNLLSLYFIKSDNLSCLAINNFLKEVNFTDSDYLFIKKEIENIIQELGNNADISQELLIKIVSNEDLKKKVVDIMFSLDDKINMNEKQLRQYVDENILCINQYVALEEQKKLKSDYRSADDDDLSSLQLQYKVRELVQARLEKINGKKNEE